MISGASTWCCCCWSRNVRSCGCCSSYCSFHSCVIAEYSASLFAGPVLSVATATGRHAAFVVSPVAVAAAAAAGATTHAPAAAERDLADPAAAGLSHFLDFAAMYPNLKMSGRQLLSTT